MLNKMFIKWLEKKLNEIRGYFSIARKAGFAIVGQDVLKGFDKKLYLIVIDTNAGNSLKREMNFLSKNKNIPLIELDGLAEIVAIQNCKVVGIKNKAISENIIKCIKGE